MRVEHTNAVDWGRAAPSRMAARIRTDSPDGCAVALLGVPDDTGVELNSGRLGAAEGPGGVGVTLYQVRQHCQ